MSILHTPVSQLRKLTKTVHHANLRFIGGASSQEFFIPPGSRLITLNAKSVIGDVEADLDGLTLRVSSALPDTRPTTELFLRAGETRALTDQVGRNVVASVVDGWPEGVSKLYATLDLGGVASGSSSGGGGTALESETFFLTEGTEFVPKRSGLAIVRCQAGGGPGGSIMAQSNLCTAAVSGGSGGGFAEAVMPLQAGVSYTYSIGEAGQPYTSQNGETIRGGNTVFNGPETVTAIGGYGGVNQTGTLANNQVDAQGRPSSPPGAFPGESAQITVIQYGADLTPNQHLACGGNGGSSRYGQGANRCAPTAGTGSGGFAGTGFGSGGSGACVTWRAGAPELHGGAGTPGCIEITMVYDNPGAGSPGTGLSLLDSDLNLYVSASGNDANPGTSESQAFATINRALDFAATIYPGAYRVIINIGSGTFPDVINYVIPGGLDGKLYILGTEAIGDSRSLCTGAWTFHHGTISISHVAKQNAPITSTGATFNVRMPSGTNGKIAFIEGNGFWFNSGGCLNTNQAAVYYEGTGQAIIGAFNSAAAYLGTATFNLTGNATFTNGCLIAGRHAQIALHTSTWDSAGFTATGYKTYMYQGGEISAQTVANQNFQLVFGEGEYFTEAASKATRGIAVAGGRINSTWGTFDSSFGCVHSSEKTGDNTYRITFTRTLASAVVTATHDGTSMGSIAATMAKNSNVLTVTTFARGENSTVVPTPRSFYFTVFDS